MGMFDSPTNHAIITLTDHRNRTLCKFVKEKPDSEWTMSDFVPHHNPAHKPRQRDLKPHCLRRLADGRHVLMVPRLTYRWVDYGGQIP